MPTRKRPNPFGPEVEPEAEGAPAIPLWIGGRAYLTMPENGFFDLRDPQGRVTRRVPLCGRAEVNAAASLGRANLAAGPIADWQRVIGDWRESLVSLRAHFLGLLRAEVENAVAAEDELDALFTALGSLQDSPVGGRSQVAVIATVDSPFAAPASQTVVALSSGASVLLKPSIRAPSALLGFAELGTRSGLPAGRLNLVHGDMPVVEAICASPDIDCVYCPGDGDTARAIRDMASSAGKSLVGP